MKIRLFYRLYLRYRRNWMTLDELSQRSDLTLGEVAIIFGVAKKAGVKV